MSFGKKNKHGKPQESGEFQEKYIQAAAGKFRLSDITTFGRK